MFSLDWLSPCKNLVSEEIKSDLMNACLVDYCMVKTAKTKKRIVEQFVNECQKNSDEGVLCDWEGQLDGKQEKK